MRALRFIVRLAAMPIAGAVMIAARMLFIGIAAAIEAVTSL